MGIEKRFKIGTCFNFELFYWYFFNKSLYFLLENGAFKPKRCLLVGKDFWIGTKMPRFTEDFCDAKERDRLLEKFDEHSGIFYHDHLSYVGLIIIITK